MNAPYHPSFAFTLLLISNITNSYKMKWVTLAVFHPLVLLLPSKSICSVHTVVCSEMWMGTHPTHAHICQGMVDLIAEKIDYRALDCFPLLKSRLLPFSSRNLRKESNRSV